MSDAVNIDVADTEVDDQRQIVVSPDETALASFLRTGMRHLELRAFAGKRTAARFISVEEELGSLLTHAGVFDLGWRGQIAVRGEDRLRWLSGMVTNTVQQLKENTGNYSLFLNAQGRIQGDANVLFMRDGRLQDCLLLDTDYDQVDTLMAHLDRFIIMDDVTLLDEREEATSIGIAGPDAGKLLDRLGLAVPGATSEGPIQMTTGGLDGTEVRLAALLGVLTPQFHIRCAKQDILKVWQSLVKAGAQPCGVEAVEALRIVEGLPRYGIDLNDRDLPQESGQVRALNFNKGCYLGQEIVERIRSRGAVHKALRQFELHGDAPQLPAEIVFSGKPVGRLTSAVRVETADGVRCFALGIVRSEAVNRSEPLTYNGGVAEMVERAPTLKF